MRSGAGSTELPRARMSALKPPKSSRRRAPAGALGSATTRFGDGARPSPGRERKSQLVPSPRGRARIAGGATTPGGACQLARRTSPTSWFSEPIERALEQEQRPVGRKRTMSFSLWTGIADLIRENPAPAACRSRAGLDRNPRADGRSGCTPAEPYPPAGTPNLPRRTLKPSPENR